MTKEQVSNLQKEIQTMIRKDVGAFAKLQGIIFMDRLPKTRSGKILRGTIKNIVNGQAYKNPSTIEDITTLDEIKAALK